jgi:hypothetical protein
MHSYAANQPKLELVWIGEIMKALSFTFIAGMAFLPAAAPMFGDVIVSDGQGGSGGSKSAFLAVSWTQTGTFNNVSIEAQLESDTPDIAMGTAYLSNKIGAGAGNGNVLDTFNVSTNNNDPSALISLFSGLTLGPGTYYLSIQQGSSLFWIESGTPVQTLDSGVTQGSNLIASGTVGTPPISTSFVDYTLSNPLFQVTGTPGTTTTTTPEPSMLLLLLAGIGGVVYARTGSRSAR